MASTEGASTPAAGKPESASLYEEVLQPNGEPATNVAYLAAEVIWRFFADGRDDPMVEADLQIPERRMKMRVSIHRNTEATPPAGLLVDIAVEMPDDLPHQSIAEVPRIVLKITDESRGQPLVGTATKLGPNLFRIALAGGGTDAKSNLALLREREWIDIPFRYEGGQRAILTFAKGDSGRSALDRAFATWIPGSDRLALSTPIEIPPTGVGRCAVLKAGLIGPIDLHAGPAEKYRVLATVTSDDYLELRLQPSQIPLGTGAASNPWVYVSAGYTAQASDTVSGWLDSRYLKEIACAKP